MSVKFICISDLHLGEPEGLLYHKDKYNIIDIAVQKIQDCAKANDGAAHTERLILNGDIVDWAMAKVAEATENAQYVFKKLFEMVSVDEVIIIPGNHDHHLWVEAVEHFIGKKFTQCTKTGLFEDKDKFFSRYVFPDTFSGKAWMAYPDYVYEDENNYFLFHHGHFVAPSILKWFMESRIRTAEQLEEIVIHDIMIEE